MTTHGMSGTKFHRCYTRINERCTRKKHSKYHLYGGRGIRVEWKTFGEFKDDMYESFLKHCENHGGRQTTIDRIDCNGNYSKDNCRWATMKEQSNNKRNNRRFKVNGESLTLTQWVERLGVPQSTIRRRLARGWSVEKTLTTKGFSENKITFNGKTLNISEWAKKKGIRYNTLHGRLSNGLPVEKALSSGDLRFELRPEVPMPRLKELVAEGRSVNSLATLYKCDWHTVARRMKTLKQDSASDRAITPL